MSEMVTATTQTKIVGADIALSQRYSRLENWVANLRMGHQDELPPIDRATLAEWKASFDEDVKPATEDEIAICVERLRANYTEFEELDDVLVAMVIEDMLDDLAGYPKKFLIEACRRWRNSPAKRAPTAGQLKDLVAKECDQAFDRALMVRMALKAYEMQ